MTNRAGAAGAAVPDPGGTTRTDHETPWSPTVDHTLVTAILADICTSTHRPQPARQQMRVWDMSGVEQDQRMPAQQNELRQANWPVEPQPQAIGQSRHLAVSLVRQWVPDLPEECMDRVQQVVGELVANAVQHVGKAPISVELWITPRRNLAVVVTDPSPVPPVPREPYDDDTRGRGLHVVANETMAWSWRQEPCGGKAVRATVELTATKSPAQHRAEALAERVRAARPTPVVHGLTGPLVPGLRSAV
ncbi:ATP-binding protein [Kitasatospora kifunensis]|uniref:Anti-sigma regulatory factor (Ser/Thr protein kinase) n=1 Tax=Kitasatospora kifunensis TaxID=58351 RepID=A0A7W7R696_KITKI|nr:ATP-binding protein [Kitasatospora kifunensis]MBB4926207.1 anti-sigma regulatory factor (Ser/Thr protein kinase) [Kitasatospora kifunensis]